MAALQARLVLLTLVGLTAAISYNAIYLQKGQHPAPFTAELGKTSPPSRTARRAAPRTTASTGRRKSRSTLVRSDTIRAIQRELATRGYDPGPVDGVQGVLTRAAVMAYQHDKGLPVRGEADAKVLEHLVLGKAATKPKRAAAPTPTDTIALVKSVQQVLAEMGYNPGPVDGIPGAGTRTAIERFERAHRLKATGRISGKLLREIMRVTGVKVSLPATG